jgi:hypothetical protein
LLQSLGRGSAALQQQADGARTLRSVRPHPTLGGHELNLDWLGADEPVQAAGLMSGTSFADRLRARLEAAHGPNGGLPEWAERLCDFFATTSQPPAWAEPAKIDQGSRLAALYGTLSSLILCCGSLPWCYLDAKGVPVLASTQRLEGTRVYRRIWETSHFVVNAVAPAGLARDGKGIFFAQRVRLLHAAVRNRLLAPRPPQGWPGGAGAPAAAAMRDSVSTIDWSKIGSPLNHEDMAYVLLTFSYVGISGLRKLGASPSTSDADAYIHLWNVVGHVLGIPQALMANTFEDAEALFAILLGRLRQESDSGKLLTRSLMTWMQEAAPGRMGNVPTILVSHLLGQENAALLGVQRSSTHSMLAPFTLGAIRAATRMAELARRDVGNTFSAAVSRAIYGAVVGAIWERHQSRWDDLARWPDANSGNEDAAPAAVAVG